MEYPGTYLAHIYVAVMGNGHRNGNNTDNVQCNSAGSALSSN